DELTLRLNLFILT
ncbi:hypothetical protein D030_3601B, partial [Vibrio parahaemolyticus AQ3810]